MGVRAMLRCASSDEFVLVECDSRCRMGGGQAGDAHGHRQGFETVEAAFGEDGLVYASRQQLPWFTSDHGSCKHFINNPLATKSGTW